MSEETIAIAIRELEDNLSKIGRVNEWAEHLGFDNSKKFSRYFLRYFKIRPQKVIDYIRLKNVVKMLRHDQELTNCEIARLVSIPNEKSLYNFINYHLGCSPTKIKLLSERSLKNLFEEQGLRPVNEYMATEKDYMDLTSRKY